jgi:hypothetical protein
MSLVDGRFVSAVACSREISESKYHRGRGGGEENRDDRTPTLPDQRLVFSPKRYEALIKIT